MDRCIAIVSDLIFATRITGTAKKVGAKCKIVSNSSALQDALESDEPSTVLVDMNCDGISSEKAIREVKSNCSTARVVAFCSHAQTVLMERVLSTLTFWTFVREFSRLSAGIAQKSSSSSLGFRLVGIVGVVEEAKVVRLRHGFRDSNSAQVGPSTPRSRPINT